VKSRLVRGRACLKAILSTQQKKDISARMAPGMPLAEEAR
jgi:hypothetical protein